MTRVLRTFAARLPERQARGSVLLTDGCSQRERTTRQLAQSPRPLDLITPLQPFRQTPIPDPEAN